MFFLLRSAACIGAVFCMLPESGGSAALRDLAVDGGHRLASEAQRYCVSDPDCMKGGLTVAELALASAAAAPSKARLAAAGRSRSQPKS